MLSVLQIHSDDNVLVALKDFKEGEAVSFNGLDIIAQTEIQAKHKIAINDIAMEGEIFMYGVLVGKATQAIPKGGLLHTFNVKHEASPFSLGERKLNWTKPDISNFENRHFKGFHRKDGKVGTANYWLVIPLVFCENRNLEVMKKALLDDLGYGISDKYKQLTKSLITGYKNGESKEGLLGTSVTSNTASSVERVFPNVDGVKFLTHEMGCGGTRQDAQALCGLLAGYISNPNVAGATVLSLGCQNAQISLLQEELHKRGWTEDQKQVYFLEQQEEGTEEALVSKAIKQTFVGLMEANKQERKEAFISHLSLGLECGGSDGFSGISANPALGYVSDMLVSLGATTVLSEFPELCGVEQELSNRCESEELALKFQSLMESYAQRATDAGSGFDMNPSPGNIKDGLITDAIKSAGAAKKGGTSPITDVLDYPQPIVKKGLNLLCTPGNDVESTTAMVGSGCNVVVFTTGLGTPTGNPIAPVLKLSSNTKLANKMSDIIDVDAGPVIRGEKTIKEMGEALLTHVIAVASGEIVAKAVSNGQDDFIPWKRGVSL